ncbi:hypothetical protein, partial [Gluconobacter oxydans]|uniref:hypothetical protein n=1 Tax=Gluconobacter oxydans TaxID=442 RepID=UPI001E31788D
SIKGSSIPPGPGWISDNKMRQKCRNARESAGERRQPETAISVNLQQRNVRTDAACITFLRFFNFIQGVNSSSIQKGI